MESKIIRSLIAAAVVLLAVGVMHTKPGFTAERSVRVAILDNAEDLDISVRGDFVILDTRTRSLLFEGRHLGKSKVTAYEPGIKVGDQAYATDRLSFVPGKDATITVGSRKFRGDINVIRRADKRLTVINIVGLEEYVKGVLFHEVSHRWPLEVLKAQAVATRTYALFRLSTSVGKDFDVTSDIYSQVYGGKSAERYRTNIAVKRTKGLVMVYKGKILPAYFHATCGGFTEDVSELWNHDIFPLKGVPCHYCINSPHYRWKRNFRSKDIQDKLVASGRKIGLIADIAIVERNATGRIKTLKITARDGKSITISGKDFRNLIGPNDVRSNNYKVVMKGYYFDLIGQGWGHGVGMCQWGAYEMARQRFTYDQILDYYYPVADIVDEMDVRFR